MDKDMHLLAFPSSHKQSSNRGGLLNVAVILAGGIGQRLGEQTPKQFLRIAGKSVLEHTVSVFQSHRLIDDICVVCHPDYIDDVWQVKQNNNFFKLNKIIAGGSERYESSLAAIKAYAGKGEINMVFHDAVRPLVSNRIITDVICALNDYDAVDVGIPATDTMIKVDSDHSISDIPSRKFLWNGQTPQGFKLSVIKEAYRRALCDSGFATTDDCGVVFRYMPETKVHVVVGDMSNMKLTYKEDIFLIDKLFQLRCIGNLEQDLNKSELGQIRNKVIIIYGGTQGIGKELADLCAMHGMIVNVFSRRLGVDIADLSQVRQSMQEVFDKYGCIDFVVNTAGVLDKLPLCDMSDDLIIRSIKTNYLGCVNIAKIAYQYLRNTKGMLLFYTSSSYTRGRASYSIYSSLKAAIVNLTQGLSEEWASDQIRVNCINPQRTKTAMRINNFGEEPGESMLTPQKVADASLRTLIADVTGEVIDVRLN